MPTVSPTTTIPLSRGAPSLDIIDVEGLADAAARAFANDPAGATAYGTSVGYLPLRRLVAEWHDVDEAQVLLTNGSMQADAFLFDELAKPGKQVVIERPTYDRTLLALRQRGAELHPVALEPDGIDTVALEALLAAGAKPTLAHIIPNFHNPAGYTLSLAKRQRLVQLAQEHNFTIFEDDPYIALRFRGETHPTMLSLDAGAGSVVYASSFSKTVCPGIRVGYLVGPADLIAAIARRATGTYISPGEVSGAIVYEFCISGAGGRPPRPPPAGPRRARGALRSAREWARTRAARGSLRRPRRRLLPLGRASRRRRLDEAGRRRRRTRRGDRRRRRLRRRWALGRDPAFLRTRHAGADRRGAAAARRSRRLAAVSASGRSAVSRARVARATPRAAAAMGRR
jgi:DNA-binding transcriptional MocR family regulator